MVSARAEPSSGGRTEQVLLPCRAGQQATQLDARRKAMKLFRTLIACLKCVKFILSRCELQRKKEPGEEGPAVVRCAARLARRPSGSLTSRPASLQNHQVPQRPYKHKDSPKAYREGAGARAKVEVRLPGLPAVSGPIKCTHRTSKADPYALGVWRHRQRALGEWRRWGGGGGTRVEPQQQGALISTATWFPSLANVADILCRWQRRGRCQ